MPFMNWFERLAGFPESDYQSTQSRFAVEGNRLRSLVNGRSWSIGQFEMPALAQLRERVALAATTTGRPRVSVVRADVRRLHRQPEYADAVFQVASQFNALEMPHSGVTPEDGVSGYEYDATQGPACAIAAGAATIYRNYFVTVDGHRGQTALRQLDGLRDVADALSAAVRLPVGRLWTWRNGYALCTREGLGAIDAHLSAASPGDVDALARLLRVGVHQDIEVTDGTESPGPLVTQVFCSALPVAYGEPSPHEWAGVAQLVLNAAYEATLLQGVLNAARGKSNIVALTLLGGGAFGNDPSWIQEAIGHALRSVRAHDLDVRIVSYGEPSPAFRQWLGSLDDHTR